MNCNYGLTKIEIISIKYVLKLFVYWTLKKKKIILNNNTWDFKLEKHSNFC